MIISGVLKLAGVLELSGGLKSTARSGGGAEKASGGHHRRRRSSHPPSNNTTTLPETKNYLTPSTKLTSDEAIVKIQVLRTIFRCCTSSTTTYQNNINSCYSYVYIGVAEISEH